MRRKTKVVWLPPSLEFNFPSPVPELGYTIFGVSVAGVLGDHTTADIPLTIDTESNIDPAASLADLTASGYRLRRIVGKIWVLCEQQGGQAGPSRFAVTAGIIVRRVDPANGVSLAFTTGLTGLNVSPALAQNWSDPWIWRRSWLLSDNASDTVTQFPELATNNCDGGSAVDGPHVDQKTARLVGPEERLFLSVTCTIIEPGDAQLQGGVLVITDLRCLATMTTSSGNRRNASR